MSLFHLTVGAQRALLRYRDGVLLDVLPSGRHRRVRRVTTVEVDLRDQLLALVAQEVPTADEGVTVRVTAALRWSVAEPVVLVERTADPMATVYLAAQLALRDTLAGRPVAELTGRGAGAGAGAPTGALTGAVDRVAREVGVAVSEVLVKDVILPAELRAAALAVHTARQRGLAQLEAARAETAALRSLANGARLLDAHPALARLRLVQAAPTGSQLVLRLGADDRVTDEAPGPV